MRCGRKWPKADGQHRRIKVKRQTLVRMAAANQSAVMTNRAPPIISEPGRGSLRCGGSCFHVPVNCEAGNNWYEEKGQAR